MIFNMVGGGGGSGATLVVSSPANVSVTVSKDDKSYTKNSGSLGSTTFKGLATGTWTVTISGNGQTATKTIEITADYAITIAFFSATINITYPANSNCVVTNSSGQTVASNTNTGSSTKTWTATVGATGTYTVTATSTSDNSKTKSQTVSITADGQVVSITLVYTLYLFKSGSGLQNGFTVNILYGCSDYSALDKEKLSLTGGSSNVMSFSPSVDLSKYSKIYFDMKPVNEPGQGIYFGISSSSTSWDNEDATKGFDKYVVGTKDNMNRETVSLDVSSVSSKEYVKIHAILGFACYVYNIYCE